MILAIDRGNSSTKAALYDGEKIIDVATDTHPERAVHRLCSESSAQIDAAIYSTVGAGGEHAMRFVEKYAGRVMSVADDIDLLIRVKPEHRPTLGADRIAAAAGAWSMMPGAWVLVVDSGTAVTYDVVSPNGLFLGGNIAPGLRIGLDALHRHTALLPKVEVPGAIDDQLLGQDTDSAMILGVVYGVVGAIESMCARLGDKVHVVLTGGNAHLIKPLLRVPAVLAQHLVTDGLNKIALSNL